MPFRSKFYVHTDARKFSSVYKFCHIRTQMFSYLFNLYSLDLLNAFALTLYHLFLKNSLSEIVVIPNPLALV